MAERRRRRRHSTNSGSEFSGEDEKVPVPATGTELQKEPEPKVKEKQEELSEYESANDYDEDEEYTDTSTDDSEDDSEDDDDDDETYDEDDEGEDVIVEGDSWMEEERQSGDGEEQPDKQALDDDEDRKNPAYIPRKGAFYEHDTRLGEEEKEGEKDTETRPKKKLWVEDGKWQHDRFDAYQQAPKSEEELVAIYGYNIHSYDTPPEPPKRRPRRPDDRRENKNLGDYIDQGGPRNYRSEKYNSNDGYYDQPPPRRGGGRGRGGRGGGRGRNMGPGRPDSDRPRRTYTNYRNSRNNSEGRDGYQQGPSEGERRDYNREHDRNDYRGRGDHPRHNQEYRDNRYREDRTQYNNQEDAGRRGDMDVPQPRENRRGPPPPDNREWPSINNRQSQDVRQQRPMTPERGRPPPSKPTETNAGSTTAIISRTITNENIPLVTTPATRTTNTITEHKSYAQERHSARMAHSRGPDERGDQSKYDAYQRPQRETEAASRVQRRADRRSDRGQATVSQDARESHPPQQHPRQSSSNAGYPPTGSAQAGKQDLSQSRPKRYSSQRQRNLPDAGVENVVQPPAAAASQGPGVGVRPPGPGQFYRPVFSRAPPPSRGAAPVVPQGARVPSAAGPRPGPGPGPGPSPRATGQPPPAMFQPESPPQSGTSFQQPQVMQSAIAYAMPPGVPPLSTGPPPQRIYNQPPPPSSLPVATMASAPSGLMQGPYVAAPVVNYSPAAPPPSHFQMAGHVPIQFQPPPPPPPPQPAQATLQTQPSTEHGIHVRGGTTYFNPQVQQPSPSRSPVRRVKVAIPIVNPQQLEEQNHQTVVVEGMYIQEHYDYECTEGESYTDTGAYVYTTGGQTATILVQGKHPDQIPEFIPQRYLQLQAQAQAIEHLQQDYRSQIHEDTERRGGRGQVQEDYESQTREVSETAGEGGQDQQGYPSQTNKAAEIAEEGEVTDDVHQEYQLPSNEASEVTDAGGLQPELEHQQDSDDGELESDGGQENVEDVSRVADSAESVSDSSKTVTATSVACEVQSEETEKEVSAQRDDCVTVVEATTEQEHRENAEQSETCEGVNEEETCESSETCKIDTVTEEVETSECQRLDVEESTQNSETGESTEPEQELVVAKSEDVVPEVNADCERRLDSPQDFLKIEAKDSCGSEQRDDSQSQSHLEQDCEVVEEPTQVSDAIKEDAPTAVSPSEIPPEENQDSTTSETCDELPENTKLDSSSNDTKALGETEQDGCSIQTVNLAKEIHIVDTKPEHAKCDENDDALNSDQVPAMSSASDYSEVD